MKSTWPRGSLAFKRRSGYSATLFSYCAEKTILSEVKLSIYQKSSMARKVTWHLWLLRQLKCLTALKNPQQVSELYQYDPLNLLSCMTLEHTEDEGLGANNNGKSWNFPVVPLSERNAAWWTGQPRMLWLRKAARKKRETRQRGAWDIWARFPEWWWWHSIFGTRSWISPQKRYPLRKTSIQFNSRSVFISFFFIFPVTEPWDCRHLLCFMHLLTLLFISLKMTYPCWYVCSWSNFNERNFTPWLQCALFVQYL